MFGNDDLVVPLEAGRSGEAAAGGVAGEADFDPGALAGAGDDVADGLGLESAVHDGVPAGVEIAEGGAVRCVGDSGGVLPGGPGAYGADRGAGGVGHGHDPGG